MTSLLVIFHVSKVATLTQVKGIYSQPYFHMCISVIAVFAGIVVFAHLHDEGVLGVRSLFFTYFYVLKLCVYVSRTRFPSSRAIEDVYLQIYLFLYHVFMPLSNLFHFASRRFFSAFSPVGGDDPYFSVPLYYIKM